MENPTRHYLDLPEVLGMGHFLEFKHNLSHLRAFYGIYICFLHFIIQIEFLARRVGFFPQEWVQEGSGGSAGVGHSLDLPEVLGMGHFLEFKHKLSHLRAFYGIYIFF